MRSSSGERMPRYFFTIVDGFEIDDRHGTELVDLPAAMQEARQIARGLISTAMLGGLDRRRWSIQVISEEGEILGLVTFLDVAEEDEQARGMPPSPM